MQVVDEATIGPTAHALILSLLANRGMLTNILRRPQQLKGVSPRMTLSLLRQLTSDAALRQFAALGRKRVTDRKDEGQPALRTSRLLNLQLRSSHSAMPHKAFIRRKWPGYAGTSSFV